MGSLFSVVNGLNLVITITVNFATQCSGTVEPSRTQLWELSLFFSRVLQELNVSEIYLGKLSPRAFE